MTESPRIIFRHDFPHALRAQTRKELSAYTPLLRRDIAYLNVALVGANDDFVPTGLAAIQTSRPYHTATLWIDPTFFGESERVRAETLLHECFHVLTDTLVEEVETLVEHLDLGSMYPYIETRVAAARERCVDHLALTFWEMMNEH